MLKYLIMFVVFVSSASALNSDPDSDNEFQKEIKKLGTFLSQEQAVNKNGQSVHAFNSKIRPFANFLREANVKLGYKTDLGASAVLDNLNGLRVQYGFDDSYKNELNQLRNYINNGQDYDRETTMKASELLSSLWGYISIKEQEGNAQDAISVLFFFLQQNTKESGGCFPGYVGRLMMVNSVFVIEGQVADQK